MSPSSIASTSPPTVEMGSASQKDRPALVSRSAVMYAPMPQKPAMATLMSPVRRVRMKVIASSALTITVMSRCM